MIIPPIRLAVLAAAVLFSGQAALAQAVPVRRTHVYEDPRRPAAQLATVYGKMLTLPLANPLAFTFVCEVDGKSYRAMIAVSVCPSVVYLLPGSHRLVVNHSTGYAGGDGTITVQVAAGRVYEIEAERAGNLRVSFHLRAKPPGYVLPFKDVMPAPFLSSTRQNPRIDPADAQ